MAAQCQHSRAPTQRSGIWGWVLTLLLTCWVTSGKLLHYSDLQFFYLENGVMGMSISQGRYDNYSSLVMQNPRTWKPSIMLGTHYSHHSHSHLSSSAPSLRSYLYFPSGETCSAFAFTGLCSHLSFGSWTFWIKCIICQLTFLSCTPHSALSLTMIDRSEFFVGSWLWWNPVGEPLIAPNSSPWLLPLIEGHRSKVSSFLSVMPTTFLKE